MYHLTLRRSINALAGRSSICNGSVNNGTRRVISSHIKCSSTTKTSTSLCPVITSASLLVAAAGLYTADNNFNSNAVAQCNAKGAEPVMLSPTKEPATGILFPSLCNGMSLVGCGVRVKWGFVKVSLKAGSALVDLSAACSGGDVAQTEV